MLLHLFVATAVAAASADLKWRREMNEFCARLPVDPHCPLLHTLNDLFASSSSRTKTYFSTAGTPLFESFCAPENAALKGKEKGALLHVLRKPGGQVKLQKYALCSTYSIKKAAKLDWDWLDHFLTLFLADVKHSSVFGYYGTDVAECLAELLQAVFMEKDVGLDVRYRLKRADWLLREARRVAAPGPIRREDEEEDGGWLGVLSSALLFLLLLMTLGTFIIKRRAELNNNNNTAPAGS